MKTATIKIGKRNVVCRPLNAKDKKLRANDVFSDGTYVCEHLGYEIGGEIFPHNITGGKYPIFRRVAT